MKPAATKPTPAMAAAAKATAAMSPPPRHRRVRRALATVAGANTMAAIITAAGKLIRMGKLPHK